MSSQLQPIDPEGGGDPAPPPVLDQAGVGCARDIIIFVVADWKHEPSRQAWRWARANLIRCSDRVVFVTVVTKPLSSMILPAFSMVGGASSASVMELSVVNEQHKQELIRAGKTLDRYKREAIRDGVGRAETVVLDNNKGGVINTLVEWTKHQRIDEGVVGTRDLGLVKRTVLALVGKGSVSARLVDQLDFTVAVVKPQKQHDA